MRRFSAAAAMALTLLLPLAADAQLQPPNELGVSFAHVHLNVADIEVHKQLWVEHFGGVVVQRGPLTSIKLPNLLVILTERAPTAPSQGSVVDHFGFHVRDIEEILAGWRAAGYEVQAEFTGAEGFPNAYLLGPDGVRIELQEKRDLPVKAAANHVHFFTPQYRELMQWYADVFGARIRPRGTIETTADVPGVNLSFGDCRGECVATVGRAIDHIGFEIEDLEAFARRLEERGIELEVAPRRIDAIGLTIAFFTDPSGARVELTEGLDEY